MGNVISQILQINGSHIRCGEATLLQKSPHPITGPGMEVGGAECIPPPPDIILRPHNQVKLETIDASLKQLKWGGGYFRTMGGLKNLSLVSMFSSWFANAIFVLEMRELNAFKKKGIRSVKEKINDLKGEKGVIFFSSSCDRKQFAGLK